MAGDPNTPKKDLRASDQDTAAETAFAAGKLPEEDRRKAPVPTPAPIPALPTQGRIIPPAPMVSSYKRPEPSKSYVRTYLIWAAIVAAVLTLVLCHR